MRHTPARIALLLLMATPTACGGAPIIPGIRTTVVSLVKIDCSDCGAQIVADLRERPGVYQARFDRRTAEVSVVASPGFDVLTAVRVGAARRGFDVLLSAGLGRYGDPPRFPDGADVRIIARGGEDVPNLDALLVRGKVTVLDFSASWCSPCRIIDEHMFAVLRTRNDVAYRRLEVGDWTTPLAQRYLKGVLRLPYVVVYGPSGAKLSSFEGVNLPGVDTAIARGSAPPN